MRFYKSLCEIEVDVTRESYSSLRVANWLSELGESSGEK